MIFTSKVIHLPGKASQPANNGINSIPLYCGETPLLLVMVGLELRKGLGINHITTAIVLENLFYEPSTCPGVE